MLLAVVLLLLFDDILPFYRISVHILTVYVLKSWARNQLISLNVCRSLAVSDDVVKDAVVSFVDS
jgi:hypothetical protein